MVLIRCLGHYAALWAVLTTIAALTLSQPFAAIPDPLSGLQGYFPPHHDTHIPRAECDRINAIRSSADSMTGIDACVLTMTDGPVTSISIVSWYGRRSTSIGFRDATLGQIVASFGVPDAIRYVGDPFSDGFGTVFGNLFDARPVMAHVCWWEHDHEMHVERSAWVRPIGHVSLHTPVRYLRIAEVAIETMNEGRC